MNAQIGRSKRGGASAPPACKAKLRSCVVGGISKGGKARPMMSECFTEFNNCRSNDSRGRKYGPATKRKKRRKSRRK